MLRSEQALFFAIPKREQDRPLRPRFKLHDSLNELQQTGDPTGIVIGAIMYEACGTKAVGRVAIADVVIVGTDHEVFLLQLWVTPFEHGENIAVLVAKSLIV